MQTYTEQDFEAHIEQHLNQSDYRSLQSADYDKSLCLIPSEMLQFIQDTQPEVYQRLERQYGADTPQKLTFRISNQVASRGVLDVLRKGVKDRGCSFDLTYFQPSSGMNPDHQRLYAQNRFSLIRQLHYSEKNGKSLDMVLFLNGLLLVTMELKNSLTGQVVTDAEKQYRTDRDPREPLFQFRRYLVHFAVGNEKVSMTTRLMNDKTRFFPFNKDIENPINPEGHKTAYLWEDILQPDNLMTLINNFIHEQETTEKVYDPRIGAVKDKKSRILVFPRYHQLDVIRKLEAAIVEEGVGHNYLIQHTTGSGKSNSIAWLAHLLTHLYRSSTDTNRIFDSVELFGRKDEEGKFVPFHVYSMRQSISEGFTLDVLQNYTTFKRYFQLVKSVPEDREYDKARTLRALTNYVDLQHHSIETKTQIILEHFTEHTAKTIAGKGRAMLVTQSRLHCVRYKQTFDRQMKEMGLPYGCLVAFSGTVHDTDNGVDYTENGMNELPPSTSIADSFKSPEYRILIVASKFQTGFDEPMLQTMYVDKRLDGLQCVQTLSRLNRVATGKTDTLVLDFVNEPEQVQEAFQQYYQTTMLAEETDPNRLYDLQSQLDSFELYDAETIEDFCRIFYELSGPDEALQGVLDSVVERWSALEINDREEFRSTLQSYIRLYGYISQLITFTDGALEKLYIFGRSLNKKLPKRDYPDVQDVLASVDLDSFRVQKTHDSLQLSLEATDSEVEGIGSDIGGIRDPEQDFLSSIIFSLRQKIYYMRCKKIMLQNDL